MNTQNKPTLEDMIITDKEISGYMDKRDNNEHTKITTNISDITISDWIIY